MRVEGLVSKEEYPHLASHIFGAVVKELVDCWQYNFEIYPLRATSGIYLLAGRTQYYRPTRSRNVKT